MREISTEKVNIGDHVKIDGVEYVAEKHNGNCSECALQDSTKCSSIPCAGVIFKQVAKEPQYRPYKDTAEMIEDYKERFKISNVPAFCMPLIWIDDCGTSQLITAIAHEYVIICQEIQSMRDLFVHYTYLDGSPCGKVEECDDYDELGIEDEYDCSICYQPGDVCLYKGHKMVFLGYDKNNPTEKAPSPVGDFDPRFWGSDFLNK